MEGYKKSLCNDCHEVFYSIKDDSYLCPSCLRSFEEKETLKNNWNELKKWAEAAVNFHRNTMKHFEKDSDEYMTHKVKTESYEEFLFAINDLEKTIK
jgi:hypothetical protein